VTRLLSVTVVFAQVIEGNTEIVNIRETDQRLGPLVWTLVALGLASLIGTFVFWYLTRPSRVAEGRF